MRMINVKNITLNIKNWTCLKEMDVHTIKNEILEQIDEVMQSDIKNLTHRWEPFPSERLQREDIEAATPPGLSLLRPNGLRVISLSVQRRSASSMFLGPSSTTVKL